MPILKINIVFFFVCSIIQLVTCKKYLIRTKTGQMKLVVVSDQNPNGPTDKHISPEIGNGYVESSMKELSNPQKKTQKRDKDDQNKNKQSGEESSSS